jgi:hypothetical protein
MAGGWPALGTAVSVNARVAGLNSPIARCSVNRRLPSGPLVIDWGWLLGVAGVVASVKTCIAWLAGFIDPIALTPGRVNQRFPSEPAVIDVG